MKFLPENKWLQLLVFSLVVTVAVVAALSITRMVPDEKNIGAYKFGLGNKRSKKTAA